VRKILFHIGDGEGVTFNIFIIPISTPKSKVKAKASEKNKGEQPYFFVNTT
jgi:hypothetical protein